MNYMVIPSLQRQLDYVAIQQIETKAIVDAKSQLLDDVVQFHTIKKIRILCQEYQERGLTCKVKNVIYNRAKAW